MSSDMRIAFLGTGLMGSHMARNILKAGFSVAAWNRTLAKAEALRGDGAEVPETAAQAVAEADVVITMLSDGATVHDLFFTQDLAAQMKDGAILIDMSSIKPREARQHAESGAVGAGLLEDLPHLDAAAIHLVHACTRHVALHRLEAREGGAVGAFVGSLRVRGGARDGARGGARRREGGGGARQLRRRA